MNDMLKNPLFYYIAIPITAALWPALIWGFYLPRAEQNLTNQVKQNKDAEKIIDDILVIDPKRLDYTGNDEAAVEFDYASAVRAAAKTCGINATKYKLSSGQITTSDGNRKQSANVSLEEVDIKTLAEFLSEIQLRWVNLQCTKVTLRKKKAGPDAWDIDLRFTYFY